MIGGRENACHMKLTRPSPPKVDLIVRAGLVDALSGPGPFTVLAPTNQVSYHEFRRINFTHPPPYAPGL